MKLIWILLAVLVCLPITLAEKDSVTTGPFKISFDIGFPKNSYTIDIQKPSEEESLGGVKSTVYGFSITSVTSSITEIPNGALIDLTTYEQDQVVPTPEELRQALNLTFKAMNGGDIESAVREIDGVKGAIASGSVQSVWGGGGPSYDCLARWWYSNKTQADVISGYPWKYGTLSLIKTIHIEKVN